MLLLFEQLHGSDALIGMSLIVVLFVLAMNGQRIANWLFSKRKDGSE